MTYPWNSGDVLTAADLNAFGGIVQVLSDTVGSVVVNTTTTLADTGLSITITPKSSSSKIAIVLSVPCYKASGSSYNSLAFTLWRGATSLQITNGYLWDANASTVTQGMWNLFYIDSPATTSATTYKLQFANHPYGSGSVQVSPSSGAGYQTSFMHVLEIAQ